MNAEQLRIHRELAYLRAAGQATPGRRRARHRDNRKLNCAHVQERRAKWNATERQAIAPPADDLILQPTVAPIVRGSGKKPRKVKL